jgi:hypothetical protein
MSGRQRWHWIAAGVAGLAVGGAVLANDGTTRPPALSAHPYPTAEHPTVEHRVPDNGSAVVASPTMDVTTVTSTTPKPKPTTQPPPAQPAPHRRTETHLTLTFDPTGLSGLPNFFDDCDIAWALGVAPMRKGEIGYRTDLDRDHDGIACEN